MNNPEIKSLHDLNTFRSAPLLNQKEEKRLLEELTIYVKKGDWFTIGIMAKSTKKAILVLKEITSFFNWSDMQIVSKPAGDGSVFLKANQKTGNIHIRIENGLGEGILLSSQYNEDQKVTETIGPLPLNIFKKDNTRS